MECLSEYEKAFNQELQQDKVDILLKEAESFTFKIKLTFESIVLEKKESCKAHRSALEDKRQQLLDVTEQVQEALKTLGRNETIAADTQQSSQDAAADSKRMKEENLILSKHIEDCRARKIKEEESNNKVWKMHVQSFSWYKLFLNCRIDIDEKTEVCTFFYQHKDKSDKNVAHASFKGYKTLQWQLISTKPAIENFKYVADKLQQTGDIVSCVRNIRNSFLKDGVLQ